MHNTKVAEIRRLFCYDFISRFSYLFTKEDCRKAMPAYRAEMLKLIMEQCPRL